MLADHDNAGILKWLPGGFVVQLSCFAVMALVGATMAARGGANVRRSDSSQ
jgi:hypothetical protein